MPKKIPSSRPCSPSSIAAAISSSSRVSRKPFFIQYRIEDIEDYQTKADFGANLGSDHRRQRLARVTVRVGDYKIDSSTSRGDGAVELAALDNDPLALRAGLWQATDQAYTSCALGIRAQAGAVEAGTDPAAAGRFLARDASRFARRHRAPRYRQRQVGKAVSEASGLYRTDAALKADEKDVQYATAVFHARSVNTYLVSSEGAIVRKGTTSYEESFATGTQAADGMHIDRSYGSNGVALADLDSQKRFSISMP
jgi:TldD protein